MQKESIQAGGGQKDSLPEAKSALSRKRRRGIWKKAVSMMSCIAVFCSTYCALMLPAITQENTGYCGYEAHEHSEDCYEKTLVCGQTGAHTHGPECYSEERVTKCGMEEREAGVHTHTEQCRTEQRELICEQEEREAGAHTHTEQCYTEQRMLICEQEESTAVHTHTEGCIAREQTLICTDASEEHEHTEGCYETTETIVCGLAEGTAQGHIHTDACYSTEKTLSCALGDGGMIPGHKHTDACYSTKEILNCGLEDGEEICAHTHTEECYGVEKILRCEIPEAAPGTGTGAEQAPGGEAQQSAEGVGHVHTDECYTKTLKCEQEEHTHKLACFSNPNADLETASTWESSMAGAELSGEWSRDLIAIAETQLGYTESSRNYFVAEDGLKGYTRYGAWYGIEYGDWCAMFISFCLHYAEIPKEMFPQDAVCDNWIKRLRSEEYKLYRERGNYTPGTGDVVFFDWNADGQSDHVGIVAELRYDGQGTMTGIKTIEGNAGNTVCYGEYTAEDERILGYGELPENPRVKYRWSQDGLEVTASVMRSEELPENAKLVVQRLSEQDDGNGYAGKFAAAQEKLAEEEPTEITQFSLFSVHLEADGQELPSDMEATIEIRLLDEADTDTEQAEAPGESLEAAPFSLSAERTEEPAPEKAEETGNIETKLFSYTEEGAEMRAPEESEQSRELSGSFVAKLSGEYAIAVAQHVAHAESKPEAATEQVRVETPHDGTDRSLIGEPDETDARQSEEEENDGALAARTPYGKKTYRRPVHGHWVENEIIAQPVCVTADAVQIEPVIIAPLVAAPMLLALLIALVVRACRRGYRDG